MRAVKRSLVQLGFGLYACALLAACGRRGELEPCNIAERTCQEDIYYAVVRLRGDAWDPFDGLPPIRTITAQQYRDELTGGRPPAQPPDDDDEPPEPPKISPWDAALQWLGLVTKEATSMQASVDDRVARVAAYYSSRDRRVTVIDHGNERHDRSDTSLLVHELVHAFQDNEVRSVAADGTTDGDFAGRARIEGEAVLYQRLAEAEMARVSPQNIGWHEYFGNWIGDARAGLPANKSPFYAVSWFVYPLGGDMLMRGWLEGGNAAVRMLSAQAPRNAVDFIARHEGKRLTRAAGISCDVEAPSEDFALAGHDRFGALQLYAFLAGNGMHEPDAWRTALSWRDDELLLYFDEERELTALSWRIRMDGAAAANTVVAAARQLPMIWAEYVAAREAALEAAGDDVRVDPLPKSPVFSAERDGNDALIVVTDQEIADWRGAVDCAR